MKAGDRGQERIAAVPVLFGVQQVFEAQVWVGLGRGDAELVRVGSLGFLFFALAVWPVGIAVAVAVAVPRPRIRWALATLAAGGVAFAVAYLGRVAETGWRELRPAVVGHSIRYDISGIPAANGVGWWARPALYLATVAAPFALSSRNRLRPLAGGIVLLAVVSYALF